MIWFQFILLFLLYYVVTSNSNGDGTTCDALDTSLGCYCVTGDGFMGNCDEARKCKGTVMGWVTKPKRTANYTVRSGDSGVYKKDVTEYTPDEYLTIHVRALILNTKYIGILLYAVDSNETKVGQWDISDGYPNPFWLPGGACGGKAIMHTDAERKNYHHAFRFKAPSRGVGTITFRCLLKEEGPNEGYFWWPNLEKDLQLTEKKVAPSPQKWYRGTVGQSCDDVCKSHEYSCDLNALQQTNSATALMDAVSRHYLYKVPVLSSCLDIAPTSGGGKDGWIWYHDDNCKSDEQTIQQVTCSSKSTNPFDGARLCACKGGDIPETPDPEPPNSETTNLDPNIGYARMTLNLSLTASLIMITNLLTRRSGVLFFGILFATFNSAHGHNWLVSPSRSLKASTVAPCRPRISTIPHIQVNKGQEFNLEWATGHSQFSYIVILARKDYAKLQGIKTTMLEEYIAEAPQSAHFENQYQRVHVTEQKLTFSTMTKPGESDLYEEVIHPNSTDYIVRPDLADAKKRIPNYLLYRYKPTFVENDVRVEYQNEKYKWIEAVYKHQHNLHRPFEMDLVRLRVLAHSGPGEYIVFWKWKGYQDCVDVEVLPDTTPVTDIYGSADGDTTFIKIDHCRFENFLRFKSGCYQVLTTPQQCINECGGTVQECAGVNVVPLRLPSNVYHQDQSDTRSHINWNMCTDGDANALKDKFAGLPDDTQVCFSPFVVQDKDVNGLYTISHDPEDLIFYSTCYLKVVERVFKNNWASPPPPEPVIPPWHFGSECVSCSDFQKNYHLPDLLPPTWKLSTCVNCDIESGPKPTIPSLPKVTWNMFAKGQTCDLRDIPDIRDNFKYPEHDNCDPGFVCAKRLKVVGSSNVLHDECELLVTTDSECSNIVMYNSKNKNCYCWKAASCCGKCSPVRKRTFWDIYDLGPNDPDPNCARGKLSNGYCCPSHCELCGGASTACKQQEGMCCAEAYDMTVRSCEHNAPPCVTSDYVPPTPAPTTAPTNS